MLTCAAISPHPPIVIPEIGKEECIRVSSTIAALETLALAFEQSRPDIIILISPHGPVSPDQMTGFHCPHFYGNFSLFGFPSISIDLPGETEIIKKLDENCRAENMPLRVFTSQKPYNNLDHGSLVPLYYLSQKLIPKPKLLPLAYSGLPLEDHFVFGTLLKSAIDSVPEKVAVIASGDLSHRLTPDAPAGYSPHGKEFDETVLQLLTEKKADALVALDPQFIEDAGQCGLPSIAILLGVLADISYIPRILSYEGPFGVGYLVADFELQ